MHNSIHGLRKVIGSAVFLAIASFAIADDVWIKTEMANMRATPNRGGTLVGEAGQGCRGKIVERTGDWIRVKIVEHGIEVEGFVHASLVEQVPVPAPQGSEPKLVIISVVPYESGQPG